MTNLRRPFRKLLTCGWRVLSIALVTTACSQVAMAQTYSPGPVDPEIPWRITGGLVCQTGQPSVFTAAPGGTPLDVMNQYVASQNQYCSHRYGASVTTTYSLLPCAPTMTESNGNGNAFGGASGCTINMVHVTSPCSANCTSSSTTSAPGAFSNCKAPPTTSDLNFKAVGLIATCMCPAGKLYDQASGQCAPVFDQTQKEICPKCSAGNPIYPGTGRKRQTETDYVGVGHYPLTFTRIYDSLTPNGAAWTHSFAYSVTYADNYSVPGTAVATLVRPNGNFVFRRTAGGAWIPDADVNFRLSGSGASFTVTSEDGRYTESYQQNNIKNVLSKSGQLAYSYVYSTTSTPPAIAPKPGLLLSVSNAFGQSLQFTYNA